jgi:hypothetical protein
MRVNDGVVVHIEMAVCYLGIHMWILLPPKGLLSHTCASFGA